MQADSGSRRKLLSGAAFEGSAQNRANLYAKRFRVGACWIGAGIDRYEDELEFPRWTSNSREFIAEKARLRPEDHLGLVRTARRSHNQLGLAYQIAFIRLTGRAPGQQPFEILEDLVGYVGSPHETEKIVR